MTATTNLSSYLKHCITRWYDNAKIDYDVNGYFVSAETTENNLYITWVEEEEEHTMRIGYYKDFTAEQLYNIWMEGYPVTYTYDIEHRICTELCNKYAFDHCDSCPLYKACCGFESDTSKTTTENEKRWRIGIVNALAAYDAQH